MRITREQFLAAPAMYLDQVERDRIDVELLDTDGATIARLSPASPSRIAEDAAEYILLPPSSPAQPPTDEELAHRRELGERFRQSMASVPPPEDEAELEADIDAAIAEVRAEAAAQRRELWEQFVASRGASGCSLDDEAAGKLAVEEVHAYREERRRRA